MFIERAGVVARGFHAGDHQRGARHQPAHHVDEQRVARQFRQGRMELGGQADPFGPVMREEGLALAGHHLAQRRDHGLDVGHAGKLFQHRAFQHLAQLEHVVRFVGGGAGDKGAAVGFEIDHAVGGQVRQHLAHRVSRGGIDLAKGMLGQLGARRQPVLHDRVVDLVIHALFDRALACGLGGLARLDFGRLGVGLGFGVGGNQLQALGHRGTSSQAGHRKSWTSGSGDPKIVDNYLVAASILSTKPTQVFDNSGKSLNCQPGSAGALSPRTTQRRDALPDVPSGHHSHKWC